MSFPANPEYLPTNFWSRFTGSGQHISQLAGLAWMAVTAAIAGLLARWRFAADVHRMTRPPGTTRGPRPAHELAAGPATYRQGMLHALFSPGG